MQNPFIKNCRTGLHQDLLCRSSHYNKILTSKSLIDTSQPKKYLTPIPKKTSSKWDQQFKANQRLVNSITDIQRNYTRYGGIDNQEQSSVPLIRKKSLKSQYLDKQREIKMLEDNVKLYKKILHPKTEFSRQKMKEFQHKIDKYSNLIVRSRKQVLKIDDKFYATYQKMLIKNHLKPNAYTHQISRQLLKEQDKKLCYTQKRQRKLKIKRKRGKKTSFEQVEQLIIDDD